jgi:hypothetical protein
MPTPPLPPPSDPTLARRARIARLTELGQQIGYGLFGAAIIAFVIGAAAGFSGADVVIVVGCLAAGSAVLAPAIVFGYAVKAAEREDRERAAQERAAAQARQARRPHPGPPA